MKRMMILSRYHLLSIWNWRSVYVGKIVEPLAYMVFLVGGIGGLVPQGQQSAYVTASFFGILCLLSFRAFTSSVSDVSNDRKWGVFAIFTMQGGSIAAYLGSILMIAGALFLAQAAVLLGTLAAIIGFTAFGGVLSSLLPAVPVALLVLGGWVGIGSAIGAAVQSYSARDLITNLSALPMILSAPLFYSRESAPSYIQIISSINPLTYNVYWIRNPDAVSLLAAGLWMLVGCLLGIVALNRADRVSRER